MAKQQINTLDQLNESMLNNSQMRIVSMLRILQSKYSDAEIARFVGIEGDLRKIVRNKAKFSCVVYIFSLHSLNLLDDVATKYSDLIYCKQRCATLRDIARINKRIDDHNLNITVLKRMKKKFRLE